MTDFDSAAFRAFLDRVKADPGSGPYVPISIRSVTAEWDPRRFAVALAQERLNLAVFDEAKHRRGFGGKWIKMMADHLDSGPPGRAGSVEVGGHKAYKFHTAGGATRYRVEPLNRGYGGENITEHTTASAAARKLHKHLNDPAQQTKEPESKEPSLGIKAVTKEEQEEISAQETAYINRIKNQRRRGLQKGLDENSTDAEHLQHATAAQHQELRRVNVDIKNLSSKGISQAAKTTQLAILTKKRQQIRQAIRNNTGA